MASRSITVALASFLPLAIAGQFVMYTPGGDDTSVQRIDPILFPGTIGQHVHQVFGASGLSDSITYDSLQNSSCTTVADASNHGNAADNSVYWHPALFMEAKNGSGYVRVPTNGHKIYYRDAGSSNDQKRDPFEFPHGFRMLAGNPFIRKAPTDVHQQNITQWICHSSAGMNQGTDGGFPTGVDDCTEVDGFNGAINFPHCWNGNDFDPANPTAHVVYPTGDIENGVCPSDHPIRLPHIFIENTFDIHSVVDQVKPDSFVLAQGDNTGYGWHADFFNGWQDGAIPALLASCPYEFYGNEDVGQCTAFKARTVKASDCKLPVTYKEEVTYPGQYLPGCNPIIDTNPAPSMPVAALGIATDVCSLLAAASSSLSTLTTSIAVSDAYTVISTTTTTTPSTSLVPAESITKPAGTTVYATPVAFSVPTTFATFFTTESSSPASSAVADTSSSTSASSASSSTSISCPASNGQNYTSNGITFEIECGVDHFGANLAMKQVTGGLTECIDTCASTSGCVDVSLSGVACYMKKSLGKQLTDEGVDGAKVVTSLTATSSPTTASTTSPPAYMSTDSEGDVVHVEWYTEYQYITVTATPESKHRRHADAHGS